MITASGIGSGLDVDGIVSQLVAVEGQPTTVRLDRREGSLQAEISAVGTFRSALSSLQAEMRALADPSGFRSASVTVSNEDVVSVSASADALEGNYSLEVVQKATAQRLASESFSSTSETVGAGSLTIRFGRFDSDANTFVTNPERTDQTLTIDAGNDSLLGIRDAINQADMGVRANIVNDGSGYRLLLAAEDTGESNGLQISVTDSDGNDLDASGLSRLAYDPTATSGSGKNLSETVAAQDAIVEVDGLTVTSSVNQLDDMIEGVSLDLLAAAPGETVEVSIERDLDKARQAVNAFVDGYNAFNRTVASLTRSDPETGERGALVGDAAVRGISSQVRRMLNSPVAGVTGAATTLTALGISTERSGSLTLDESVLDEVLANGVDGVASLFARFGQASDALISTEKLGDDVPAGEHAVNITQVATRSSLAGAVAASTTVDANNDTLVLKVDGVTSATIQLTQGAYASGAELAEEIARQANADTVLREAGVGISVEFEGGGFRIESNAYGSNSVVEIVSVDTLTTATLGLSVAAAAAGLDLAGTIGGVTATGSGQTLIGTGRFSGLELKVLGGGTGSRGTVAVSEGGAERLNRLIEGFLESDGTIDSRLDGLNARLEDVAEQRERLALRLERVEERLRAEFGVLDSLVAELSATGTFLNQQLANLPGFTRERNGS